MTREEHETTVIYDYADESITLYTTRRGVRNQLISRLPDAVPKVTPSINGSREVAWTIRAPMEYFRAPHLLTKGPATVEKIVQQRAA